MAGHIREDSCLQPVDYKGGKLSNHLKTEFSSHHRYDLFCFTKEDSDKLHLPPK